ncbi:uncharacterized protein LOC8054300 isoform X2 [Sorghum bicolor]|uniref:ATPase AAA-type core domain-containing protein n=2 Tax=Sorghum bicolor TaxID=4558 RepID=A0A1B6QP75_SORBI|nr:uncharacterized protein LOC8054300 isoform X2 [Sorghum bicolor]KXG39732.1 hypothetical protein SORBI_3001G429200 [Sorghum bicolor]|eukprot:XP_021305796.1 uncharacterized protein LOC8054300 isoform X2 [Sorghum bicolor]
MGGSADPEAPSPSPSPVKPSPPSADGKQLRRCVQSKLSWGLVKPAGGGSGGGGKGGGAGEAGRADAEAVPPVPAAEEAAATEVREEPEKGKKKRKPRKSENAKKPSSNKEKHWQDPANKDEVILVDESPQKKQRKGRKQDAIPKVPNASRKRCKMLESPDGPGSCQQLHISQIEAGSPVAAPVIIDIDLMSTPSKAGHVNPVNQDISPLKVDLRSEAKMAAEEIRRLSSGKKIHPFFASRKMNKCANQDQDVINIENVNGCDSERDPPFYPIHVAYQSEASIPIHWSSWIITDLSSFDTDTASLKKSVSFFEGLVKPLTIETNCKRHSNQLAEPILAECTTSGMPFPITDKQSEHSCPSDAINVDDQNLLMPGASCQASLLDLNVEPEVPQNGCQPTHHLWTDKYRPETAAQVCGNNEHVKFLAEWLKGWDERGHKIGAANGDTNGSSYQDESDSDYSESASDCENTLLITGPVGCGKSAAVFACAKEQGFNVIEVNTSDMRNGAYVRQKFEEATKSHGLEKWSHEEVMNPLRDDSLDPDSRTPDRTEYQHLMSCTTRVMIDCDQPKSPVGCYSGLKACDEPPKQVANKTLILFEDVDTVFDEDRGFISTILKMAETTKWPIILTSNRKDPSLPNLLDQLVLNFKYPSTSELLPHVAMICKSEGLNVTVPQLKHVIDICLGDIRRTVMLLQFWYQGKHQFTERPKECSCGPFSLDLDAVHSTVPKMLPWEFPCKLSETLCMEVDKSILLAEEKEKQKEISDLEGLQLQVTASLVKGRSAAKTRKAKKSKLKAHSTEHNDISPCKNELDDFHDLPDIPLPSDKQIKRNRHCSLLLSESDDDPADVGTEKHDIFTVTEVGFFPQPSEVPPIHGQGISDQFCFPVESRETFEIADSFQNPPESNMYGSISQVCDTFMSQGVSCVPESSLIVEGTSASLSGDEFLSRAVSNDFSAFYDGTYTTSRMVLEDTDSVKNLMVERQKDVEDVVGETSEAYMELFGRNEQASCSTAGFQLMDECSRAESIWLLSGQKTKDSCKVEQVQDTWNRLRSCCLEFSSEANHNRAASGALKLASEVSDLISESDLMLSRCYPLTEDMLDPFSTPCAEPDDSSWYSKQFEMGSVYAQHALCIFSRNSQKIDGSSVDLSQELLFASTAAVSLGKIICSGFRNACGSTDISHMKNPTTCISKRERHVHLCETLSPVVPPKLLHSLRGPAFVDYLSSISQISQLENLRLSENKVVNKQRRSRQSRHYLSSGALPFSPEDVVLLAESGCFGGRREKVVEQAPGST